MRKILILLLLLMGPAAAQVGPLPGYGPSGFITSAYPTLDPATLTGGGSLSNGNLTFSSTGSAGVVRSTKFATGKFYFEFSVTTGVSGSGNFAVGVIDSSQATATPVSIATVTAKMWLDRNDAMAINNGSGSAYGSNWGASTVLSVAVDNSLGSGSGKVWVGQCSGGVITWPSSGNPTTGANPMFSNLTGNIGVFLSAMTSASFAGNINFGATAFSCNAPFGHLAG